MRQQRLSTLKFNLKWALINVRQAIATREVGAKPILPVKSTEFVFVPRKVKNTTPVVSTVKLFFVFEVMGSSPARV